MGTPPDGKSELQRAQQEMASDKRQLAGSCAQLKQLCFRHGLNLMAEIVLMETTLRDCIDQRYEAQKRRIKGRSFDPAI